MVPIRASLLRLVKHAATLEAGFLGETFGRPFGDPLPWFDPGGERRVDIRATANQSRELIIGLCGRVWAHSAATI